MSFGSLNAVLGLVVNWLNNILRLDPRLWWLWLITFPLTLVWIVWSTEKTKKTCNKLGGMVFPGLMAGVCLLAFYGPLVIIVLMISFKIMGVILMHPSVNGLVSVMKTLCALIPLLLFWWLLSKVPMLPKLVTKVLSAVNTFVGKIWKLRERAETNPNAFYMMLGALVPTFLINGQFITNLTNIHGFPQGIIPAISGLTGLVVLVRRTALGHKP